MSGTIEGPGFLQRLLLSWIAAFAILFDRDFAARVAGLRRNELPPPPPPPPPVVTPPPPVKAAPVERVEPPAPRLGLHVLALLQREGRLIDFLLEDISGSDDAEVGAAARVVHEGCSRALATYLTVEPILTEDEGATVTVPVGFDAARIRLSGNVVGAPPFSGSVRHHGWHASGVRLPQPPAGLDPAILAPAEVELP